MVKVLLIVISVLNENRILQMQLLHADQEADLQMSTLNHFQLLPMLKLIFLPFIKSMLNQGMF